MSGPIATLGNPGEGPDRAIHCPPPAGFVDRGLLVDTPDDGDFVRIPLEHPLQADSRIARMCGERAGLRVSRGATGVSPRRAGASHSGVRPASSPLR